MQKLVPTWLMLSVVVVLAIAQGFAVYYHWYFFYPWLDIPMHIIGGFWLMIAIPYFFPSTFTALRHILPLFVLAMLIGVGWELFEFSLDKLVAFTIHDMVDTLDDLKNDALGALLAAALLVIRRYNA